jgi:hypothetical protein
MPTPFGVACRGITHPHVSVRLDIVRRINAIRLVGVADPHPANQGRLKALSAFVEGGRRRAATRAKPAGRAVESQSLYPASRARSR